MAGPLPVGGPLGPLPVEGPLGARWGPVGGPLSPLRVGPVGPVGPVRGLAPVGVLPRCLECKMLSQSSANGFNGISLVTRSPIQKLGHEGAHTAASESTGGSHNEEDSHIEDCK